MVSSVEIGEGFSGSGADAAHINTLLGQRDGPVGSAFASALATPSPGHTPFLCVYEPGVPCEPPTLFVNKATIAGDHHGELTWGAAQAGVAEGVAAFAAERFSPSDLGKYAIIVAVWVNPLAQDASAVLRNNRDATLAALRRGGRSLAANEVPAAVARWRSGQPAHNPYFDPR
ncbi:MAG: aldehyde-activating protein [Acidimicrobiales bacterium mtb01]|nr:formaldehyde-activating enzyme [Actinomycetota bacterium]TEX46844.1 MAG: aldehyde-activating protein [Acidimicrobiales bacterium mtb01]